MKTALCRLLLLCSCVGTLAAQTPTGPYRERPARFWQPDSTLNAKRLRTVLTGSALGFGAVYTWLGVAWYANQETSRFHWYDDSHQWLQMDKVGHSYWAYQESRLLMDLLAWSGVPRGKRLLWGGMAGFLLQSPVEIFDGFVPTYGASVPDLLANASGSGLVILNEALWRSQRIQFKFSFWPTEYPSQRPDVLGTGVDKLIKDYNGQTYWLSAAPHAFIRNGQNKLPPWLCLSVGYSGSGMLGGYGIEDPAVIRAREYRQWLLSVDIDFTKIKTRSGFLRGIFYLANLLKAPAPALSLENGRLVFYGVYY
jgi:hypothetical protein